MLLKVITKQIGSQEVTLSLPTREGVALASKDDPELKYFNEFTEGLNSIVATPVEYAEGLKKIGIDYKQLDQFTMFVFLLESNKTNKDVLGSILTINGTPFTSYKSRRIEKTGEQALVNCSHQDKDGKIEVLNEAVLAFLKETIIEECNLNLPQ